MNRSQISQIKAVIRVKRHLKLANKFSGGFIKFDKTSGKIAKVSKKTEIIAKAYVIFQFVVIIVKIWSITAKTGNLIEKILGIAITSLSTTVFLLRYHTTSAQVQVQFLNYIFFSEGDENDGKSKFFLTYLVLFFDALEFSYYSTCAAHWLMVMFFTCQPGLASSILCSTDEVFSYGTIVKSVFVLVESYAFLQASVATGYHLVTVLLTGVIFLWIECGDFIQRHQMEIAHQIEYRRVQALEKLLNACTREQIFLKTAMLIPTCQMMTSFVAVKMTHLGHDLIAVALMWLYLMTLAFTLLTFSAAAKLYGVSQKWITDCKGTGRKKYARKFQRSLRPLRLEFGNNFVEVLTPLVV
ncbi:hypothetical protein Fcan01_20768 [Folsomia candida]|uniref:Gustatory receptor n=1 Tax=Folsomia candida TaxID=158441 RepID=A0A226DGS7_FOLCA|nr:hypothetical protein Fcan01_20768 [Folsomia candida]